MIQTTELLLSQVPSELESQGPILSRGSSLTDAIVDIPTQILVPDSPAPLPTDPDTVPLISRPMETDAPESDTVYNRVLRPLRFDSYPFERSESAPGNLAIGRVSREVKSFGKDLPCEETAAIYVRMDRDNMSYFQAMISGCADTPYAYGLFLFEITLPEDYPNSPPKMQILTTGEGTVRFNPNLYAEGYICLSVINTWGSSPEEMWSPTLSTMMQVLVSIQSLVMDSDVIQKEPGYESYTSSSPESQLYRDIVKYNTMKWGITEQIRNPTPAFAEVIKNHFSQVKETVLKEAKTWVEQTSDDSPRDEEGLIGAHNSSTMELFQSRGRKVCLQAAYEEMVAALQSL